MNPLRRTLLPILLLALLAGLVPTPARAGDAPQSTAVSRAGASPVPCEVLRDRLFVLEHRLHALEAELMALRARLAALEDATVE